MAPAAITQIFISLLVLITRIRPNSTSTVSPRLCSICSCQFAGILGCESRNLTEIPSFTGKMNFSLLFYHNNSIKSIHKFPELREVRELVLRDNEIVEIAEAAFKNLVNLVVLDLSHNKLNSEELQPRVFRVWISISYQVFRIFNTTYIRSHRSQCWLRILWLAYERRRRGDHWSVLKVGL